MTATAEVTGWVRPPAVAGLFYAADPVHLRDDVVRHVRAARIPDDMTPPKAVIAPHAGYRYSGPTAGHAYRALAPWRGQVQRVVVIGPAHRVAVHGVGVCTARAWRTPLGDVTVDETSCRRLVEQGFAVEADDAHAPEHSIEVQLPFVQEVLGPVSVVPLIVGRADPQRVADVLDEAWGGGETLVVASSDLSHYLDDASARERDRRTATAILEGRADDIGPYDACGCAPIRGLLSAARRHGLAPRLLDLSTSADTEGDADRVVGYGGFALLEPGPLADTERRWLLGLAQRAIDHELTTGQSYPLMEDEVPARLLSQGASFVTLERGEKLLGCIGSLEPKRALWRDVACNARSAAFEDPRFPPLTTGDAAVMSVKVSVLSDLVEMPASSLEEVAEWVRPGIDGVVLEAEGRRGTFLPSVWAKLPCSPDFVRQLLRKAGLSTDEWPTRARAWRYTTDEFGDPSLAGG